MTVTAINLLTTKTRLPHAVWGANADQSIDRLNRWLTAAQTIINENYASRFPSLTPSVLEMSDGRRYIRVDVIVDNGRGQRSVFAFIDKWTGSVLRAATYKAPAKHARGNLFDASSGVSELTPYGPKYLR